MKPKRDDARRKRHSVREKNQPVRDAQDASSAKAPEPPASPKSTIEPTARSVEIAEFEVGQDGVLLVANFSHPSVREDVYPVSVRHMNTPADLIDEMDICRPLANEIYSRFEDFVYSLDEESDELPELSEDGAREWVKSLDEKQFKAMVSHVTEWLSEPWDDDEAAYYVEQETAQGRALAHFIDMDNDSLRILGVKVIEGEHPGSSYYAAELHRPIDAANRAARKHGIPVRFVKASAETCGRYGWSVWSCGPAGGSLGGG